jgi:hypothetical protein
MDENLEDQIRRMMKLIQESYPKPDKDAVEKALNLTCEEYYRFEKENRLPYEITKKLDWKTAGYEFQYNPFSSPI